MAGSLRRLALRITELFNNVTVPGENLLGEVDSGFIYAMERLPRNGIGCAISNLAHAKQAFPRNCRIRQGAKPSASRSDRSNT